MNNNVAANVVPKNLMVNVKCSHKGDPLGIALSVGGNSKWELDALTGLLATRILALGNRVHECITNNKMHEAKTLVKSIQSLSIVIRDLQIWPLINGQSFTFKHSGTFYAIEAESPRKIEELERAKDHYLKGVERIKLTGNFNTTKKDS